MTPLAHSRRHTAGLTLIELIVVVTLVAVLMGGAVAIRKIGNTDG